MTKKIIVPVLIILIIVLISYFTINRNRYLVIGTNPAFPPFEYLGGEDGSEIVGFDLGIAKEIAKDYQKNVKIEILDFNELIYALEDGRIDMVISALSITEERMNLVDFSVAYYADSLVALVRSDDETFANIHTKEALARKKKLATRLTTTAANITQELVKNNIDNPVLLDRSWVTILGCLFEKKVDAIIIDSAVARAFVAKYDGLAILPIEFEPEYFAVAVKKGNDKLRLSINKTIKRLVDSRDYYKLVEDYIEDYVNQ